MSASLTTQIRDYYSYVDEQQGAVDMTALGERRVGEQQARPVQLTTPPRRSELARPLWTGRPTVQRHRLAVVLVTVASVLLLLGAVNWLLRSGVEDSPVVTQPPSPTLSSSTWSRVPYDEAVFGEAEMSSVTVGGPGLVAVGTDGSSGPGRGAVWTSPDGITWSRTRLGPGGLSSVTVGGPGLVAVGWVRFATPTQSAAVWTSPDGITWSQVPQGAAVFGGEMNSVTAGGPGLVAVGSDGSDAAVWTSPDGFTWSRVPHDETLFGGSEMTSVTVGGPGLVAVGLDNLEPLAPSAQGPDGFVTDAAVWTSSDGFTWSRVPHDETVFGVEGSQRMNSVTAGGPGLVAVGSDEIDPYAGPNGYARDAAVWTSPDGFTWSRVPHNDAVFDATFAFGVAGAAEMTSVTVGGPGLVAVGEANSFAAVWTSPDGFTWSPVFRAERVVQLGDKFELAVTRMSSVVAGGPGLVAVGGGSGSDSDPVVTAAVWVAMLKE